MQVEIVVPQIGEAVAELTLTTWLKRVGDSVKKGDVLFEVDSDKAIVEVEAYVEGVLSRIIAPDGSAVMPQDVVAIVETAEVATGTPNLVAPSVETAPALADESRSGSHKISPVAQRLADELGVDLDRIPGNGPGGRITVEDVRRFATNGDGVETAIQPLLNASPKARRLAKERNVDLRPIKGTGVGGMIRAADVEAAYAVSPAVDLPVSTMPLPQPALTSKLRQTIAARMVQSKTTIPHFYLMVDVDMTQVNQLRVYCRDRLHWDKAPTYTDILLRASARSLVETPAVNVSYGQQGLRSHANVHIGVAVNTDDGLIVPVIQHADRLTLRETSESLRDAVRRAQDGRLKAGDTGEKSMVISNLGMYGVDAFIAIIDMPDPMILAVGRVSDRVVPVSGVPAIRPMCTLTLSVDHRALDGVQAAQFLERIKDHLENPYQLMGS